MHEPRIAELVILIACRHYTSDFMWFNHVNHALKGGLSPKIIDDITNRREPTHDKYDGATAYAFVVEVLKNNAVSNFTLGGMKSLLGERSVVEMSAFIAYYHSASIVLSLSDIVLPDDSKKCLLP